MQINLRSVCRQIFNINSDVTMVWFWYETNQECRHTCLTQCGKESGQSTKSIGSVEGNRWHPRLTVVHHHVLHRNGNNLTRWRNLWKVFTTTTGGESVPQTNTRWRHCWGCGVINQKMYVHCLLSDQILQMSFQVLRVHQEHVWVHHDDHHR